MTLSIASWNINSVRLRAELVKRFAEEGKPDILCLQETKTIDGLFPLEAMQSCGFEHIIYAGQKGYNGVAILSKLPLTHMQCIDMLGNGEARHISAVVADRFALHNVYIPAGGDIPDAAVNPKFKDKLAFVDALTHFSSELKDKDAVILGDFNIAPHEHDVWSHKQLLNVVSHTPIEVEKCLAFQAAGGWVDTARHFVPLEQKLYSWWSYRARDWQASNRGRRLDHIWVSASLASQLHSYEGFAQTRGWEKPSDHVPVMVRLNR